MYKQRHHSFSWTISLELSANNEETEIFAGRHS